MRPPRTSKPYGKHTAIYYRFGLLTLVLLCKVVMTFQLWKYMQANIPTTLEEFPYDSPALWPEHSVAPVHQAFEDTVHFGINTHISDDEWSSLTPNDGLIYLGDEQHVFSISMFHELRCLNIIRQGIMEAIDGNAPPHLVHHCLNYIRQMIFCRSNTMLTGFVQSSDSAKPHSFLGIQQCNDWIEIYKEAEKNQEKHQRWMAEHGVL